jgi:glycosyltransferase involved in cell wall biosynthesis
VLVHGLRSAVSLDSETLNAMGVAGRDFVASELKWERIANQFHRLYEETAKRTNPG